MYSGTKMSCGLRRSIAIAFAVEHEDVDEMRPGIDFAARVDAAASADRLRPPLRDRIHFEPNFVRVDGPFGERMAQLERAHHRFQEILLARLQRGNFGRDRARASGPSIVAALSQCRTYRPASRLSRTPARPPTVRARCSSTASPVLAAGNSVIVHAQLFGAVEELGPEVVRRMQRHMARGAILLGLGRDNKSFGRRAPKRRSAGTSRSDSARAGIPCICSVRPEMLTLWQVEQNSAVLCSGLRNVFLWNSGFAFTSWLLMYCSTGLSLNANG